MYSYFRSRGHPVVTVCFNSNRPTVFVEKSKIGFQDGGYGSHFEFPISMILAIFPLQVNLLLYCWFQLNSPCSLREESKKDFQDGVWISDRHDFSSFQSKSCLVATKQVLAQINQRFGKRCRKLIFKMAVSAAILDFPSAQF